MTIEERLARLLKHLMEHPELRPTETVVERLAKRVGKSDG